MLEKPKRPNKIHNQDNKQPQTIQDLIRRYDLENTKVYDFLDELVDNFINRTYKCTPNSTYIGEIDINSVIKFGNVCQVSFRGKIIADIPNNVEIFSLPFTFGQNLEIIWGIGERYTVEQMRWAYGSLERAKVMHGGASTKGKYIHFNFNYICKS